MALRMIFELDWIKDRALLSLCGGDYLDKKGDKQFWHVKCCFIIVVI